MTTQPYENEIQLPPGELIEPPARRLPRLQPYFVEQGDDAGFAHDFLLQNPRPDLTETAMWPLADERRKLALDLP